MMKKRSCTILRNGIIIDGTGSQAYAGDVVMANGRIASVIPIQDRSSSQPIEMSSDVVDCRGCVVAPGFIDAHSHSDLQILQNPREKLLQGVTCEVVGNCGFSAFPAPADSRLLRDFANGIFCGDQHWSWGSASEYLASASKSEVASVVSLVGHGSLRIKVAGNTVRALTAAELDKMCNLLDEALEQGAAGMSSGLMYAPGSGASAEELTMLCDVVARRGGVYATHLRSYSAGLVEAVKEQITIATASGCRLQISHLQAAGEEYWPLQQRALEAIEVASTRGVDVSFDVYPWLAGSTVLTQLLPQTALEGGVAQLLSRLADPQHRAKIRTGIKAEAKWDRVVITSVRSDAASLVGRSIWQIAAERGTDPETTVMDLLLEQQGDTNVVEHCQSIDNLHELMTHPLAIIVTDGVHTTGISHPRLYGTFPLLLGNFVRERKWLSLEDAIHKMTAKPATVFRLRNRGVIERGRQADITVFDRNSVGTRATYEVPNVPPTGIRSVWRNGQIIMNGGDIANEFER